MIKPLFLAELRMVLRDRRILITSILLPLLVTPLMFLGSNYSLKRREKILETMQFRYAVTGSQADVVRSMVDLAKELRSTNRDSGQLSETKSQSRRGRQATKVPSTLRFDEVPCTNAAAALGAGQIQLVVEGLTDGEQKSFPSATSVVGPAGTKRPDDAHSNDDAEPTVRGVPVIRLVYRADRDDSAAALAQMQLALRQARSTLREKLLHAHGFPVRFQQVAVIAENDIASPRQIAGLKVGRSITLLLLLFILTSGAVVATDSLAGEKERGTLETLLTTAVSRREILAAKSLVIIVIGLLITLIQTLNLLAYVGLKLLPVPAGLAAAVTPSVAILLFALFLPIAALAANVLLLISGYARSYKEAQMYFLPVLLLGLMPALSPFLPGVSLRSVIALVPVANLALAAKEILLGSFDWPMIALSWLVTALAAWWTTGLGLRVLATERLVLAAQSDAAEFSGGLALFERQVWAWFGVLWACLLILSNYMEKADLRIQIIVNLPVLFFGTCVLMIRRYGLNPRQVLSLRPPRPAVWLGVLAAVPGGFLTAVGLFQLANLILPVSTKMTESFNEAVFPKGISTVQLVFFLTVLPGIFEEIAFRGLLLHGLHRRLRPAALVLVVGLVFGIFHVTLFRFVPTACLGAMFAAVTLLTGSIYPAMLWHALSNALGILAYKLQLPENELNAVSYLCGAGLLAIAFWIFWRNRTPYPGLRLSKPLWKTT